MNPNEKRRPRGRARGFQGTPPNQSGQSQSPQQFGEPRPAQAPPSQPQRPQQFRGPQPTQAPPSQPQSQQQFRGPRSSQAPPSQPQRQQQFQGPRPTQAPLSQPQRQQQFRGPRPAQASPSQPQRQQQFRGPRPAQASPSQPQVEQVTTGIRNLSTDALMPIGRRPVRDSQFMEDNMFIPQSSTARTGKQGSGGTPIELISNYFPITTYTDWTLYQYRVEFEPDIEMINIRRGLLSVHKQALGAYIFDGTMLCSSTKYKENPKELLSNRSIDDEKILIKIKFTGVIEKGDYAFIQLFNILLRKCLGSLNLQLVGRHFYDEQQKTTFPRDKIELWPGYETTIGMFDGGLLLRSEISTKIMRTDTVLDFFKECAQKKDRNPNWMIEFKMGVIGSVVITRHNNRTYKIDNIEETMSIHSIFSKNSKPITFADYYREKYKISNLDETQPMLSSNNKKVFNIQNKEDEVLYLVPELCNFTGITDTLRKNDKLMKNISNYTKTGPAERINKYHCFIERILNTPKPKELLKQWNLTLSNQLVTIPGRILRQEIIKGNQRECPTGYGANWTKNLRDLPMFRTVKLLNWTVLSPCENKSDVEKFITTLRNVAKGLNFDMPPPNIVEINVRNKNVTKLYADSLESIIRTTNPPFILCIILYQREDLYSVIKRKLCTERAVLSQVVLSKHVMERNMSVCTKIAIQINCKLNGAAWRVEVPGSDSMMIIGYDVCHDTQNKNKSYGAFIATTDKYFTSFFSCVQQHESGQELSTFFSDNISKAIEKFRIKNNALPLTIIIYRDGVGDGQLGYVQKTEVNMVKETCKRIYKNKKVGLAFIIVKKRINTKFFKLNDRRMYENPPPGTVVDSVVTDPTMYDFYLVSQHSTQGTVTPTHYNVIFDNLSETTPLSATQMQRITYKLTHMYYNWSGTIRVPAPCHLAHKLAFMAAKSLKKPINPGLEDYLFYL